MKVRTVNSCQECGAQVPRWVGRCPECGTWGSVIEEPLERSAPAVPAGDLGIRPLIDHDDAEAARIPTGIEEMDRVLGGGLAAGSVVLLAGEPGIGKSTLTLQAAMSLGPARVLLVCGEEGPAQVRSRARRLGEVPKHVRTLAEPVLPNVLAALEAEEPAVMIVDSVQTLHDPDVGSAPGSVSQVRECGARLARAARDQGTTLVLVGHVTKEGTVAGPRVLEHLVDVVLQFEGDRSGEVRTLRALKNRFGATDEVGFFQMRTEGLVAIRDASKYLLADRCGGVSGSVLAAVLDGRRPFVIEIQALVAHTASPAPRRTALGIEPARLPILVAVLQRQLNLGFAERDVFVSAVGGLRAMEPAADLPTVLALLAAWSGRAIPSDVAAFGEVGLAGEVRQVHGGDRRIAEARHTGCRRILVPVNFSGDADPDIELIRIRRLAEAREFVDEVAFRPD